MLDAALRRRFRFVDLLPDEPPIKGLLARFLAQKAPDVAFLAGMLDFLNAEVGDPHAAVGPSHFLLRDTSTLDTVKAKAIWTHAVVPALADRFFDRPGQLKTFGYEAVRARVPDELPAERDQASTADDEDE